MPDTRRGLRVAIHEYWLAIRRPTVLVTLVVLFVGTGLITRSNIEEMARTIERLDDLDQLERRRDALLGERIDPSWQDGSVGGIGIPGKQTEGFNRRIDEAADLPALEKEIAQIRARLTTDSQG